MANEPETTNVTEGFEFECPKCYGSHFGSSREADGIHYHCHGNDQGSCRGRFSCHEKDWWRYQRLVRRQSFSSHEEYEKAFYEHHNGNGPHEAMVPS